MSKIVLLFVLLKTGAIVSAGPESPPLALEHPAVTASGPRLAMGPDPGGKTGEGVTPETTKTDHPAVKEQGSAQPRSDQPQSGREESNAQSRAQSAESRRNQDSQSGTVPR
jgi:hypothetical protein